MNKVILTIILILFSTSIRAGVSESLITSEDVNKLCKIDENSMKYSEGGFPIIVDKYTVSIHDKGCGIKMIYRIYDFISEGLAKSKLHDLVEEDISRGIALKAVDKENNNYIWEQDGRKLVIMRVKNNYVFSVVVNVDKKLFPALERLIELKFSEL